MVAGSDRFAQLLILDFSRTEALRDISEESLSFGGLVGVEQSGDQFKFLRSSRQARQHGLRAQCIRLR